MGRFPGETSCLSLVWAVLDLFFSHASNGATFTDVDRQHLYRIKYDKPTQTPSTRRSQPHRLTSGNQNRARIYSGEWTRPRWSGHSCFQAGRGRS
jgi:hypothetical protein